MLVLLDRDWGLKPTPRQKFSVSSVGVIFNQWGVKPPTPDKSNAGRNVFLLVAAVGDSLFFSVWSLNIFSSLRKLT